MSREKILIVEDDKYISKLVKYNLEKAGYECTVVITGEDALEFLDTNRVDLIVLDIMLPKMDGFDTCREIKQDKRNESVPVIMLTARGEEIDRIVGLELGADDYMVKPFSPRELVLRIKAILKRKTPKEAKDEILSAGPVTIDIPRYKVTVNKKPIKLTAMEFKLLVTLLKSRGRVQSREILLDNVWGISSYVTTRTVDTHIKSLRHKLGKASKLVDTIRGVGYCIREKD